MIRISYEQKRVLESAISKYGGEHQKMKCIEEMGELVTAMSREQDLRSTSEEVITEIADVFVTLNQLAMLYGIQDVQEEFDRKVARLEVRMNNDYQ